MNIEIKLEGYAAEEMEAVSKALTNKAAIHDRMATDAEKFIKKWGAQESTQRNHRTANRLGAKPTGHLGQAYAGIESTSTASSASLLIPRASRLRAAFGRYVLTPTNSKYLTIPVAAEAYGKRAGEMDDLFFMRVGPKKTPVLARRVEGEKDLGLRARPNQRRGSRRFTQAEIMYVLLRSVTIQEDKDLIPFAELEAEARDAAEEFIDDALEASLA